MLRTIAQRLSLRRDWHADVTRSSLRADAVAGLTGAAIVLPQGVAFALIAGLPPEYGLFAAIVVTIVAALWGSSRVMVSGPTTAISALVFATLSGLAAPGSEAFIALALTLTFLVGLLQLAAGLAGLGALIAFVSHSVIIGFTAAAALLIAVSQLPGVLGIAGGGGGGVLERLHRVYEGLGGINPLAIVIGVSSLATLVIVSRISKKLPAYIVALAVGALVSLALDGANNGIAMFRPLETIVPAFTQPQWDLALWGQLIPGAAAVAFVGLLEAISIGKSFAFRRGDAYDSNQEILGQGMSNLAGSFLQSYAGSGSFTRSGLNAETGAQTPLSAVFAALFLAAGLFAVAPYVQYVPVPAMAAVIIYVAWRLINLAEIRHILDSGGTETTILLATFLAGVFTELDFAIFVGVVVSLSMFIKREATPHVFVGAPIEQRGKRVFRNAEIFNLPQCPQIRVLRIDGPLFFASVEHVEREFSRIDAKARTPQSRVISLKSVGTLDLAGADFLIKETRKARAKGLDVHLIAAQATMVARLKKYHVTEIVGEENIHTHKTDAMAEMVKRADDNICAHCTLRIFEECAAKRAPAAVAPRPGAAAGS